MDRFSRGNHGTCMTPWSFYHQVQGNTGEFLQVLLYNQLWARAMNKPKLLRVSCTIDELSDHFDPLVAQIAVAK